MAGTLASADPRAAGRTLAELLIGQRVRHVETQVGAGDTLGVELGWDSGDLVTVAPHPVPTPVTVATGLVATLRWQYLPAKARGGILRAPRRVLTRYHPGDGSEEQRCLNEWLVGERLAGLQAGAQTAEGYGVTRAWFDSGLRVLLSPLRLAGPRSPWVLTWALPRKSPRLVVPGHGFLGPA